MDREDEGGKVMDYPDHLKDHKEIYERYQAGEKYADLAREKGVSVARVRQKAIRWERYLWHQKQKEQKAKTE